MGLRVPHVTSYARAPSSLLFLRSARYPQMPRFLQFLREFWPMPLPLMNHSALALFAQRTRIPTSARSIGFCAIWVCISSSSSSRRVKELYCYTPSPCSVLKSILLWTDENNKFTHPTHRCMHKQWSNTHSCGILPIREVFRSINSPGAQE